MKFDDIIARFDSLYINQVDHETKAAWLNRLEAQLEDQILQYYSIPESETPEYVGVFPYDEAYIHYLNMKCAGETAIQTDTTTHMRPLSARTTILPISTTAGMRAQKRRGIRMYSTYFNSPRESRCVLSEFYGVNHRARISDGEFADMQNMSSDHFPLLSPRAPRTLAQSAVMDTDGGEQNLNGLLGDVGFAAVWGTGLYYMGQKIEGLTLTDDEKKYNGFRRVYPDLPRRRVLQHGKRRIRKYCGG